MMPPFILALLLFWQKRKLNILIMIHIAIVMTLYARAFVLSPNLFGDVSQEINSLVFGYIYGTTKNFLFCFGFIWLYEWWYIGRRRSEINGEW